MALLVCTGAQSANWQFAVENLIRAGGILSQLPIEKSPSHADNEAIIVVESLENINLDELKRDEFVVFFICHPAEFILQRALAADFSDNNISSLVSEWLAVTRKMLNDARSQAKCLLFSTSDVTHHPKRFIKWLNNRCHFSLNNRNSQIHLADESMLFGIRKILDDNYELDELYQDALLQVTLLSSIVQINQYYSVDDNDYIRYLKKSPSIVLKQKFDALEQSNVRLGNLNADLTAKKVTLEQNIDFNIKQVNQLKSELKTAINTLNENDNVRQGLLLSLDETKAACELSVLQASQWQEAVAKADSDLINERDSKIRLETQLKIFEDEHKRQVDKIAVLESELQVMSKQFEQKNTQLETEQELTVLQCNQLKLLLDDSVKQLEEHAKNDSLNQELYCKLDQQSKALEQDKADAETSYQQLSAKCLELEASQELAALDYESQLLQVKTRLQSEIDTMAEKVAASHKEFLQLTTKYEALEASQEQAALEYESQSLQVKTQLQSDIDTMAKEAATSHNEFLQLTAKYEELEASQELAVLQANQLNETLGHYYANWIEAKAQAKSADSFSAFQSMNGGNAFDSTFLSELTIVESYQEESYQHLTLELANVVLIDGRRFKQLQCKLVNNGGALGIELRANNLVNPDDLISHWPQACEDEFGQYLIFYPCPSAELKASQQQLELQLTCLDRLLVLSIASCLSKAFNGALVTDNADIDATMHRAFKKWSAQLAEEVSQLSSWMTFDEVHLREEYQDTDYEHLWLEFKHLLVNEHYFPSYTVKVGASNLQLSCAKSNNKQLFAKHLALEFRLLDNKQAPLLMWPPLTKDEYGYVKRVSISLSGRKLKLLDADDLTKQDIILVQQIVSNMASVFEKMSYKGANAINRQWADWIIVGENLQQQYLKASRPSLLSRLSNNRIFSGLARLLRKNG